MSRKGVKHFRRAVVIKNLEVSSFPTPTPRAECLHDASLCLSESYIEEKEQVELA